MKSALWILLTVSFSANIIQGFYLDDLSESHQILSLSDEFHSKRFREARMKLQKSNAMLTELKPVVSEVDWNYAESQVSHNLELYEQNALPGSALYRP